MPARERPFVKSYYAKYAQDPENRFVHNENGNGHIYGYEMKVSKQKLDWAETKITVEAPTGTINRLSVMWNGRLITIEGNYEDESIKIEANGARMEVQSYIENNHYFPEIQHGYIKLVDLEKQEDLS